MPGPSNGRKKRKSQGKSQTKKSNETRPRPSQDITDATYRGPERRQRSDTSSSTPPSPIRLRTPTLRTRRGEDADGKLRFATEAEASINSTKDHPLTVDFQAQFAQLSLVDSSGTPETVYDQGEIRYEIDQSDILLQKPYIHNPGNGPRVRDTRAFLASKYFAQPPALDDPLCAEFAQEEVLQMLKTVLPEEMALILWYNKSRATSRICPACQRLYHVGDVLPDHAELRDDNADPVEISTEQSPQLKKEQHLSGICSSMCFILASFNQCDPRTTRNAWGHTGDEIDDASWAVLNRPSRVTGSTAKALVMIIRMTRLDDLGLAQLCFPDAVCWREDGDENAYTAVQAKGAC